MLQRWHWAPQLRPLSLAPPRGSCGKGDSATDLQGGGEASNQSLTQKTRTVVVTPVPFSILKVQESNCLNPMDLSGPQAKQQWWYQGSLLAFFHSCLVTCFLMVHKLLDSLAAVEKLIAHVEEKQ